MTTFSTSLTKLTALLPQLLRKQTNTVTFTTVTAETHIYAHTASRSLPNCDISLGLLRLPVPEAGDFVESLLLYMDTKATKWR